MSISPCAASIAPTAARSRDRDELHRIARAAPRFRQPRGERRVDRAVRPRTASEPPRRIAALPDIRHERPGIGGDIGAALIDDADHADRHAHPGEHQPFGPLDAVDLGARRDRPAPQPRRSPGGHGLDPARIELQPVEHRAGQAIGFGGRHVFGIGGHGSPPDPRGSRRRRRCSAAALAGVGIAASFVEAWRARRPISAIKAGGVGHAALAPSTRNIEADRSAAMSWGNRSGRGTGNGGRCLAAPWSRVQEKAMATGHGLCLNCGDRAGRIALPSLRTGGRMSTVRCSAIGHEILHGVFHFEGKLWRTLPMLAWRPRRTDAALYRRRARALRLADGDLPLLGLRDVRGLLLDRHLHAD